eukprot:CAMPEP_0113516498 /NCGR_PEP_ID=MMETSP0014_2-20120614/41610_1 /TAXON_ID=2857 /ORGANISM="Nitzschia sp." /LENGTH=579 /DNA_ID=CAMNT_0000413337 /DNA_START=452 /DNA_END=2187 /DNA_ORIENTATION=+ /assembly_acc=CAM_ASM_000159
MLFPAVHELGFKAGQTFFNLYYSASHHHEEGNGNIPTSTTTALLLSTVFEIWDFVKQFPLMYKTWWLNLVENDPLHVFVETTLLISIVYMILSRNTEGYKSNNKQSADRLTPQEQEELLWEWKHKLRSPLAPPSSNSSSHSEHQPSIVPSASSSSAASGNNYYNDYDDDLQIVVQKQEGKWLTITTNNSNIVPIVSLSSKQSPPSSSSSVVGIISKTTRLGSGSGSIKNKKKNNTKSVRLEPPAEKKELLGGIQSNTGGTGVELKVLNFCNFDFLGFQTSDTIRDASTKALNKYGCGSCGPRGFYGTIDTHLQLEESIANFTHTDNAIMYSDGASTCSSTVAAFAKRGDVLVVDEGVYEPITTGITLSRANVHWFKHNDVEDLERVLKELEATDRRLKRKPNAQRRFIVVEGLYKNIGSIAPLDKIVELKHKYHYRLMLDESFSFGTLGKTGRGALEEHGKRPMHDAEIITIALENSLGSIGGVTVGNEEVVDHQRLSGAGYCFSASAPPFTASAAIASLKVMEERPGLVANLQSNVRYMYQQLEEKLTTSLPKLIVTSDPRSPIVVLQLEHESVYEAA